MPTDENRKLSLDLWSLCILSAKEGLLKFPEFIEFIRELVIPELKVYFKQIDEYKFGIRLIRLFKFFVQYLYLGLDILIEFMGTSLDHKPWLSRVLFELDSMVFTSPQLVKEIMKDSEQISYLELRLT